MDKNFCVYEHICPNGKRYIGITGKPPHLRWGKNGTGYKAHNQHFFNAICKYGWDNIIHNIIAEGITKECACEIEQNLIKKYKTNDRNYGYNKSAGGECSGYGVKRVISEETRQKISGSQKGRKLSPESIKKRVESRKGYTHSGETRNKISEATKIPVLLFSINDEYIAEYESILEASIQTGIAKQNICKCCKGFRNTAGGYKWKYKIEGASHKKEGNLWQKETGAERVAEEHTAAV